MAGVGVSADAYGGFEYDGRGMRYPYSSRVSWPIPIDQTPTRTAPQRSPQIKRSASPLEDLKPHHYPHPIPQPQHQPPILPQWGVQAQPAPLAYPIDTNFQQQLPPGYAVPFRTSPTEFAPSGPSVDTTLPMDDPYVPMNPNQMDAMVNWQNLQSELVSYTDPQGLPNLNLLPPTLPDSSPTETCLEVRSFTSSCSESGWANVEYSQQAFDPMPEYPIGAISNPGETLHGRTLSDSSCSDLDQPSHYSFGSYLEVPNAISSPGTDSMNDVDFYQDFGLQQNLMGHQCKEDNTMASTKVTSRPPKRVVVKTSSSPPASKIKKPSSPQGSPVSPSGRSSPPTRRQSRKVAYPKPMKAQAVPRRPSQAHKPEMEKRVGRRKGPLRPEQRKQAGEIRKLGACLRCKFLKKTCDKGEPCAGCQPSHARLWVVPCTRIDIKELAYFMKDWRADYERDPSLAFPITNIKGFADTERTLYITHGYGQVFPVMAREVFVKDEGCFGLDWVETANCFPEAHAVNTAKLSAGMEGISSPMLSEYVDAHIDNGFESFVNTYFDGTPFLTQMLKTAYHYWHRERTPVVRKCLKLLIAYNLTQHVTMVEGVPEEERFKGKIMDWNSQFRGKTAAPVMINFQVKSAMANLWRELQKEVLDELSQLYSSVYTRDKLKHWPTIFMVATILLGVWEEMQFDCQYRVPVRPREHGCGGASHLTSPQDRNVVEKFCHDMESVPVGVIVGLFSAISQKLPPLAEWDSKKHHAILNSNPAVCRALDEVRGHVNRFGKSSSNDNGCKLSLTRHRRIPP